MSGIGAHGLAPGPAALGGGDDLEHEPWNVLALVAGPALRGRGGAEAHGRDVEEGGEEAVALGLEEGLPLPAQPLVDPLAALLGKGDQVHALGLAAARDV